MLSLRERRMWHGGSGCIRAPSAAANLSVRLAVGCRSAAKRDQRAAAPASTARIPALGRLPAHSGPPRAQKAIVSRPLSGGRRNAAPGARQPDRRRRQRREAGASAAGGTASGHRHRHQGRRRRCRERVHATHRRARSHRTPLQSPGVRPPHCHPYEKLAERFASCLSLVAPLRRVLLQLATHSRPAPLQQRCGRAPSGPGGG